MPSTYWTRGITLVATLVLLVSCQPAGQIPHRPTALYVAMPDGVRIAIDVWLPDDLKSSDRVPTIVEFTRYWRDAEFENPVSHARPLADRCNGAGYAFVIADARGTGASFGTRGAELSLAETRDFYHVVDWIVDQRWSNGRVAPMGISYGGDTAENAVLVGHPAIKASVPRFTDFDWYASLIYAGGLRNRFIVDIWSDGVSALDANDVSKLWRSMTSPESGELIGVKPVDADPDRTMLAQALQDHRANTHPKTWFRAVDFRDDAPIATSMDDPDGDSLIAIHRFKDRYEELQVPMYHWASWMDAGTAQGVLARLASWDVPYTYVIGPWSHAAYRDTNIFNPPDAPLEPDFDEQYAMIFSYLDPIMKEESPAPAGTRLDYFTMGEDVWKTTEVWPPEGTISENWYLGAANTLSREKPSARRASDAYVVNFDAGTGQQTRWSTQLGGGEVDYGDRAGADRLLLTYTSAPLASDLEITGHPVLKLRLASTHTDGAVIGYLETVAPDGRVTMITEGQLRLICHRISDEEPPYETFGPYHTYRRGDADELVPGRVYAIEFVMLPTSVLIPAGYSLRLAIAGHDKDTFDRYPAEGDPTLTVYRDRENASQLILPVMPR